MKAIDGLARMGCVLLACIAAAVALPAAAGDSIEADWNTLFASGDADAIYATYALIEAVTGESGEVDADLCRAQSEAIAAALQTNPAGLAVWYMAQACARAAGDETLAQQRFERFEALLRHTLAAHRPGEERAMRILSERDVDAVVAASGQTLLYSLYQPYDGERELIYTIGLWDDKTQRETVLNFDYLDAAVRLRRTLPEAEFPIFRRHLVEALRQSAQEDSPDSPLARVMLTRSLGGPDGKENIRQFLSHAYDGDLMSAVVLAMACGEMAGLGCRDDAVDALLPFAEKRHAMALIALAFVYARHDASADDIAKARALIEQADQRMGEQQGSVMFAGLGQHVGGGEVISPIVQSNLRKAARKGNRVAGLSLAVSQARKTRKMPAGRELAYVEAAANDGVREALFWLASIRLVEKKPGEAVVLMRRAAEDGFAPAQNWLGAAHYFGRDGAASDQELGLKWLRQAAHGGMARASVLVGSHYLQQSDEVANLQRAREWLRSAAVSGDLIGMLTLARLHELDIEGVGTLKEAAGLYEAIIADHDSAEARRELAVLLANGLGVAKDTARAETLLRGDAQKGDAISQRKLSLLLEEVQTSAEQLAESVDWLRKAAAAGDSDARDILATRLWYGRGVSADPAAARALWQALIAEGEPPYAGNNLAWALCTPRDTALLDAKAGLAAMEPLTQGDGVPAFFLSTLASCQAADGDFDTAVSTQQRAIATLETLKKIKPEVIADARARLQKYQRRERAMEER